MGNGMHIDFGTSAAGPPESGARVDSTKHPIMNNPTQIDDLRERVATACRVLGNLNLTKAATGHASVRIPGTERILIRARGPAELGVRYTTRDEIVEANLDGTLVGSIAEGLAAPQEIFIHTEIYRARRDVGSVIHIHPPTVVLFTMCDTPLLPIYGAYDPASLRMLLGGIPTYPRSVLIRTPQLGADLAHTLGSHDACLMRGHGITATGTSVEEAALNAIGLNELATMNYQTRLLGNPEPISQEDQAEFLELALAAQHDAEGNPRGRIAALWKYYVMLTQSAIAKV